MISKRLRTILDTQNITMEMLSLQSGVPLETIRNLFYHKAENPRLKTVLALSRALGVTVESLLSVEQNADDPEDKLLLYHYHQASSHGQHLIRFIASMEADLIHNKNHLPDTHTIPYFYPTNAASDDSFYTTCDVRCLDVSCPEAFAAIRIPNNQNAPEYWKDDILLLANRFPNPGEHTVFYYNSQVHLRKFQLSSSNEYLFTSIYERTPPICISRSDKWLLMGTCIGILRITP